MDVLGRGARVGGDIILALNVITAGGLTDGQVNEKLAGESVFTRALGTGEGAGTAASAVGDTGKGRVTSRVGSACVGEWLALQSTGRTDGVIIILR